MLRLLGGLKDYLKWQPISTDSAIFRLHNLFTTAMLMACSLVVTASQYVGNPIQCIVNGLPTHPINTYCWIMSTFTMPDAFQRQVGVEVAHPGVGPEFGNEDAKKYYTYYQWVCFVLFFQACLCYVPKWLWDNWEGGLIRCLVTGLNVGICKEDDKVKQKKVLMDYFIAHIKRHNTYAVRYWFCEALCLVNIIGQLYLMNRFFDGEFMSYGLRVLTFSEETQEERVDPMVYVFPRVTKCTFHKFGPTGTIQKHDSLCILPLNIWFWFIILATLLTFLVIYRVIIILMPGLRPTLFRARNRMVPLEVAEDLSRNTDIGDWWVLYMLGRNMDPLIFKEVVTELSKKIQTAASNIQ